MRFYVRNIIHLLEKSGTVTARDVIVAFIKKGSDSNHVYSALHEYRERLGIVTEDEEGILTMTAYGKKCAQAIQNV